MADLYFAYGKALLENAIAQNSVLGKEQPEDAQGGDKGAVCSLLAVYCADSRVAPRRRRSEERRDIVILG